MKTTRMVMLLLVTAVPALAAQEGWSTQADDRCEEWNDRRERVCELRIGSLAATGRLELDGGANGGVSVEGWDGGDVEVTARVRASARSLERAEELIEAVRIEAEGGRVRARGPRTDRGEGWHVSWEVRVPRSYDLVLEATNGGVSVSDVTGRMELRTTNGGLRLDAVGGDVYGRTTNGGVHVVLDGDRWQGGSLDVQSTNGGVDLRVPEGYSAELEVATTNGGFSADFPITVRGRLDRRLETTLGDGGPLIRAVTTNGGVKIRRP